jgi:3-hydroxyacyl-[acyl-carrier-protein] dehydratase
MPRDIEEIRRLLPLGYPYLLVDRILEETEGTVVALKNVTINEPFFQGHFIEPGPAVMPGTLVLEAMIQTAAFLLVAQERGLGYLVEVEKARFRRKVVPGDQLRLEAHRMRTRRGVVEATTEASVDGEPAASAVVTLMSGGEQDA